jgi:putative membrane protein
MLSLYMNSKRADLILSDLHPGPFYPVGGSNLPYDINMKLRGIERGSHSLDDNSEYRREHVIVLHSISDHSLNLPSRSQVEIYLGSLDTRERIVEGSTCTEPVVVEGRYSYVTGVALGSTALLILESKHGMEDIPMRVRREVEEYSSAKGFKDVLLIDAHNSIGKHLNDEGADDMIDICKEALNSLASMKQYEFKAGVEHIELHGSDIGCTGAYVMMMHVNTSGLILIWIDANNALNGVREYIMDGLKRLYSAYKIVLCTSDTHATSGRARNRLGYYPLGTTTSRDRLASVLLDASSRASERLNRASYELSYSDSEVKVMGDEQFLYYSNALDRALMITKVSLLLTIVSLTSILLL